MGMRDGNERKINFQKNEMVLFSEYVTDVPVWGVYSLKSNCTFHLAIPLTFTSQRIIIQSNLSRRKGKPTICIGENKGAEQLRSYFDSKIHLRSKSKISSL